MWAIGCLLAVAIGLGYSQTKCPWLPDDDRTVARGDKCYRFILDYETREEPFYSRFDCFAVGQPKYFGTLVSIHSEAENQFLLNEAKRLNHSGPLWIGLHDYFTEGEIGWFDNSNVNYTNYASGNDGDNTNRNDCYAMESDGKWKAYFCYRPWSTDDGLYLNFPSICQFTEMF